MSRRSQYSLDQLAHASGVPARTIRSWIQQGVLPRPSSQGRGAHYEQEHMDRLLFVEKLREARGGSRMPLGLLKETLDHLYAGHDPDIVRRVASGEESVHTAAVGVSPEAAAYLAGHREVDPAFEADEIPPTRHAAFRTAPRDLSSRRAGDGPYTTIQIDDDLELRLRGDDPERVAWLARLARRLRGWVHDGEP